MNPKEWMDQTWKKYRDLTVRLVSIPLPPLHVKGLIYRPDCFASKTFDKVFTLSHERVYRAASVTPSPYGPAVLLSLSLGELIGHDDEGYLTVVRSSCCATVSYAVKHNLRDGKGQIWDYADAVTLDNINFTRSCNPGSHISVPRAPFLSALLQFDSAPDGGRTYGHDTLGSFHFLAPSEAEILFPGWDFRVNEYVDTWLGMCAAKKGVKFKNEMAGLGEWSVPYLRQLRTNYLRMQDSNYGQQSVIQSAILSPQQVEGEAESQTTVSAE